MSIVQRHRIEYSFISISYRFGKYLLFFFYFILFSCLNTLSAQNSIPPYYTDSILDKPTPFAPGLVLGNAPSFTPDGRTVYTHLSQKDKGHSIMESHFINGKWTRSEAAKFSGKYDELEPYVSPDGSKLYFFSFRPYNGKDIGGQIWVMEKKDTGWSEPKLIDTPVTAQNSMSGTPSLAKSGNLYFGSNRRARKFPFEIYFSKLIDGKYSEPININDTINQNYLSWSHCIAPDESFLIFCSERPDGYGGIDLFISFKRNNKWCPAVNLGPIVNSEKSETWPRLSPDGKYLFFRREEKNRILYQIDIKPLIDSLIETSKVSGWIKKADAPDSNPNNSVFKYNLSINKHPYASNQPISTPKKFDIPGIKNAAQITFTPDGNTFYLLTGGDTTETVCYSNFKNGKWSVPAKAEFVGNFRIETPSISPDGKKFFFTKLIVKGKQFTTDIYMMDKKGSVWGEPVKLDTIINSPAFNSFPSSAANGNLYFISTRDGKSEIFCSKYVNNRYSKPEALDTVINKLTPYDAFISPDESYILFRVSNKPDSHQLYISFNKNGRWSTSYNLGPKINFNEYQGRPYISPDGNYLFYASANTKDWISSQYQVDIKPILDSLRNISNNTRDKE